MSFCRFRVHSSAATTDADIQQCNQLNVLVFQRQFADRWTDWECIGLSGLMCCSRAVQWFPKCAGLVLSEARNEEHRLSLLVLSELPRQHAHNHGLVESLVL